LYNFIPVYNDIFNTYIARRPKNKIHRSVVRKLDGQSTKKKRILLVDDEHDNSSLFRVALEDDGFDIDVFNDPILALSAFSSDHYDLLILDIKMPKMNGYELYEKIRKIDDKVKVCFLTASVDGYREEYRPSFASFRSSSSSDDIPFLVKPIAIDDLVKKVNEIIAR
jgi:DNA-binding response OmpR family regulator